jgi:hypothetical protein
MSTKETMTLEQVSDRLLSMSRGHVPFEKLTEMADAINAHLASQPAEQPRGEPVLPDYKGVYLALESALTEKKAQIQSRTVERAAWAAVQSLKLADALASPNSKQHPDDAAVDAFAAALKAKLAEARAKGRGGWNNDEPGMQQRLSDMLRSHVEKGDPRDVGNFAMFLHQRGEAILPAQPKPEQAKSFVKRWSEVIDQTCMPELSKPEKAVVPNNDVSVRDPHHDGLCEWRWDGEKLWHRAEGQSKWTEVKRISFTKERILAIAGLLAPRPAAEQAVGDGWREACEYMLAGRPDELASIRAHAASLASTPRPAVATPQLYAEARRCDLCDHIGINDASTTQGACHNCDWTGPEQVEDKCPGCGETDCMAAACPECGGRYALVASTNRMLPAIATPAGVTDEVVLPPLPKASPMPPERDGTYARGYDEDDMREYARLAALTSPSAGAVVPEGQKLVPFEPTEAMRKAGAAEVVSWGSTLDPCSVYRAMLAAAPEVQ